MTIRLVGLMSLVLLLSLAAFALLMGSYHGEVMDEVTRTISNVGRETLRTFEFRSQLHHEAMSGVHVSTAAGSGPVAWQVESDAGEGAGAGAAAPPGLGAGHALVIMSGIRADAGDLPAGADGQVRIRSTFTHGTFVVDGGEERVEVLADEVSGPRELWIQVEQVRAESRDDGATVLRIPAVESPPAAAASGEGDIRTAALALPVGTHLTSREFVLPIPTREFQDLFAAFRRRTVLLFVGVFLLGTILSASLAARFTRPVRRLDAGIRRITDGDLDVKVEAHGKDEIGRLARAFNEMTGRLRQSRDRERDLRRREKLSALGRLAAGVAHDVRNPLHSIGLTLQHLQETARPDDRERGMEFDRSVGMIREEIRRLDRLVENFLRFARSDRQPRATVDLAALLREVAALVEKEAERRGVRVEVACDEAVPPVPADAEAIRGSVLNLVLNAFEAMQDGGNVSLRLRSAGHEVLLEVSDTGCGIPDEEQERVFEFAYTTREEGHGLGLAMVHQVVVENHGGRVSLESRPGQGTRVRLALPAPGGAA